MMLWLINELEPKRPRIIVPRLNVLIRFSSPQDVLIFSPQCTVLASVCRPQVPWLCHWLSSGRAR